MLVDPSSGALVPGIEDVLRRVAGDERFRAELRAAQIELVSRPYLSAADVGRELAATRLELAGTVGEEISLLASGSHPIATAPGPITNGDRYEAIALDNPWAALHMLTCGLHIHVAVAGGDRALAVHNALRSYLPELAALSANSPYRGGRHTGIASTRLQLNRSLVARRPAGVRELGRLCGVRRVGLHGRLDPGPELSLVGLATAPRIRDDRDPGLRYADGGRRHRRARRPRAGARGVARSPLRRRRAAAGARQPPDHGEPLARDAHRQPRRAPRPRYRRAPVGAGPGRRPGREARVDGTRARHVRRARGAFAAPATRGAERQARVVAAEGPGGLVHWLARRTMASSHSFRADTGLLQGPPPSPQSDEDIGPAGAPLPVPAR